MQFSSWWGRFRTPVIYPVPAAHLPAHVAETFTAEDGRCLVTLVVEYEYWPPDPANGCPSPYVEILAVRLEDTGDDVLLSKDDLEQVLLKLWANLPGLWQDLEDNEIARSY
jgi:hypothetical protein